MFRGILIEIIGGFFKLVADEIKQNMERRKKRDAIAKAKKEKEKAEKERIAKLEKAEKERIERAAREKEEWDRRWINERPDPKSIPDNPFNENPSD